MRSHFVQLSLVRTWRITKKLAGTYSSISETSSPSLRNSPRNPDKPFLSAHACAFGAADARARPTRRFRSSVNRRRCRGRRLALRLAWALPRGFDSRSSSRNSSCSICRASFSDFRPNCMRCSLASSSFRCSISLSRDRAVARCCRQDQRFQRFRRKQVQIRKRRD